MDLSSNFAPFHESFILQTVMQRMLAAIGL